MLKPIALVNGHYECRSLKQTVPILTDRSRFGGGR